MYVYIYVCIRFIECFLLFFLTALKIYCQLLICLIGRHRYLAHESLFKVVENYQQPNRYGRIRWTVASSKFFHPKHLCVCWKLTLFNKRYPLVRYSRKKKKKRTVTSCGKKSSSCTKGYFLT